MDTVTLTVRVEPDPERPMGHARLVLGGTTAAALTGGFRIRREGFATPNLGPTGWDVTRSDLKPIAVSQKGEQIIVVVGPSVVRHMEAGPAFLALPADGREAGLFWPDDIDFFDGQLPPDDPPPASPCSPSIAAAPPTPNAEPSTPPRVATRSFADRLPIVLLLVALAAGASGWFLARQQQETAPPQPQQAPQQQAPQQQAPQQQAPRQQAPRQQAAQQQAARLAPGTVFRDCLECPELVVVPPGETWLASGRNVIIAMPFAVGKFEITFAEWDTCVAQGGCSHRLDDRGWGRGRQPAINVSWDDAQNYVAWLSRKTGKSYRLLSEAEWEYAAQAGTGREFAATRGASEANCDGCGSRWDKKRTAPVGSFAANPFGLYDMLGNVWEWTADCWNASHANAPSDGTARTIGECSRRVLRGGSWLNDPGSARSADRFWFTTDLRIDLFGFRVARPL